MLRFFLHFILPLIFPTAMYLVWVWFDQSRTRGEARENSDMPWIWLISIGFALSAISLVFWGTTQGSDPSTTYMPPQLQDGKIVPGDFK
jgi:nitric oxide reductase large subunit